MLKKIPDYLHSTYKIIEVAENKDAPVRHTLRRSVRGWAKELGVSCPSLSRRVKADWSYNAIIEWAYGYKWRNRGKNIKYKGVPIFRYCKEHGYNYQHVKYLEGKLKDINKVMEIVESGTDEHKPRQKAENMYICKNRKYFLIKIKQKYVGCYATREEAIKHRNRYLTEKGLEIPD